jgi:glyoxylase-like metal-dependent hydrolase (beta-lactamase superfamily II)
MAMEVKLLSLVDIWFDSSQRVLAHEMGVETQIPVWGSLILGNEVGPILVDTGVESAEVMQKLGMKARLTEEQRLENQLGQYGLEIGDVRYILHTHLHIDHCGQDSRFPMSTTVVVNRRELEFSVSGVQPKDYYAEDIKHLVDRLHTPGALRLLDLELSGPDEIFPGIVCDVTGAHTDGSMNINVHRENDVICICGDVFMQLEHQLINPVQEVLAYEPHPTGNHTLRKREEKAAAKKALNSGDIIVPTHDYPARVANGRVVERLGREL